MSDNTQTQEVGVVTGKVISNKMDKSIVSVGRTPNPSPNVW